jgi:hypothetical protein
MDHEPALIGCGVDRIALSSTAFVLCALLLAKSDVRSCHTAFEPG